MGLSEITNFIKTQTKSLGFVACGITPSVYNIKAIEHFKKWLNSNYHGNMNFLFNSFDKRTNIYKFYPAAKSVVVVLLNYYKQINADNEIYPKIAKYAMGKDYHKIIYEKLKILLISLKENYSNEIDGKIFVDTSPVLEKTLAMQAGLGWIGKNCLLINKDYGSYNFLGGLILNIELDYDKAYDNDYCSNCVKCIEACPTGALVAPRMLDARKCISYLTIENKEIIPMEFKNKFKGYIYGCDICQDICPWNKDIIQTKEPLLEPNMAILKLKKEDWLKLSEVDFKKLFKNSPVERIKYKNFKRNIDFVLNS